MAADRTGARQARRVLLVDVARPALAVGEALITKGAEISLGAQHDARVPHVGWLPAADAVPASVGFFLASSATAASASAAATATCKRHGVRGGWRPHSLRLKQAAVAAARPGPANQPGRGGWGWGRLYRLGYGSKNLMIIMHREKLYHQRAATVLRDLC